MIGATIFAFGLVHGLGLSTRLQALGLPDDGLVWRVIAFNAGVEIGQLVALSVVVAIGYFVLPVVNWPRVRHAAYIVLAVTGVLAAAVLSLPGAEAEDQPARTPEQVAAGCTEAKADPPGTTAGGHPPKRFYQPSEAAPQVDLQHVIGDGYIVVRYRPGLARDDRLALAAWIRQNEQLVAAADARQREAVRATAAYRTLTCSRFDMRPLTAFGAQWFADLKNGSE